MHTHLPAPGGNAEAAAGTRITRPCLPRRRLVSLSAAAAALRCMLVIVLCVYTVRQAQATSLLPADQVGMGAVVPGPRSRMALSGAALRVPPAGARAGASALDRSPLRLARQNDDGSLQRYEAPAARTELRILCSPSTITFLTRMAQQYELMRPDVSIVVAPVPTSETAFQGIARGDTDMALSSLIPTAAHLAAAPDVVHLPLWAYAYGPITNVPSMGGLPAVFSLELVCRIFGGNITHWNDPALVALNPLLASVAAPIQVVLVGDELSYVLDFTTNCGRVDADFAALITPAAIPAWPRHLYASSAVLYGITGPISYVVETPHSFAVVLSSYARKLGAHQASMLNRHGAIVRPNYASIDSAVRAGAVLTLRDASGSMEYKYSSELSNWPGMHSWPLNGEAMMAIPHIHVRTTCRAQAELVKFLTWVLDDTSMRYTIGQQEDAVLMPEEVALHLGLRQTLAAIQCGTDPITIDDAHVLTSGGGDVATIHPRARDVMALHYKEHDPSHIPVRNVVQDSHTILRDIQDPDQLIEIGFFFPHAYKRLYPGQLEAHIANDRIRFMPYAAHGVIPSYSFSPATLALLTAAEALPLKVDMETLGGIFTGAIRSWTDPALASFNPALGVAFGGAAAGSAESQITLVLYGVGDWSRVAHSALSNALMLSLNQTAAVRDSSLSWMLPADWRPVTARLDALGVGYVMVDDEVAMEAAVNRIPGAVGYKLAFSQQSNPQTDFAIVRTVQPHLEPPANATAADLLPYDVTVLGTPSSFAACAEAAQHIGGAGGELDLQTIGWSAAPSAAQCWPMTLLVTIAMAADIASKNAGVREHSESLERICASQARVARYAEFIIFSVMGDAERQSGFAPLVEVPWLAEVARRELNGVWCAGQPIMYTPAVVWELSNEVRLFAYVASLFFAALTVIAGVLLVKFHSRTIIRSGNLPLQLCVLVGLLMLLCGPVLFVVDTSALVCRLLGYLICLGFTLAYVPVAVKIWRVHATYCQRRKLIIHRISAKTLYAIVVAAVVIDVVLLASQNSKGALLEPGIVEQMENSRVHQYEQCTASSGALPIAGTLIGLKAALLLVTSVLAFGVRHVSSAFNESANLSWAVWNTTLSSALLVTILALVGGGSGDIHTFLLVFLLIWISATTLLFAFGKKLAALLSEEWRSATEASRLSRTSRTSKGTSNTSGGGTGTGSFGSSSILNSSFQMPSLSAVPLLMLEKYMTSLETQLRMAKEHYRVKHGSVHVAKGSEFGASGALSELEFPEPKLRSKDFEVAPVQVPSPPTSHLWVEQQQQQQQKQQQQMQARPAPSPNNRSTLSNSRAPVLLPYGRKLSLEVPAHADPAMSPTAAGGSSPPSATALRSTLNWPQAAAGAAESAPPRGASGRVSPQPHPSQQQQQQHQLAQSAAAGRPPLRINPSNPLRSPSPVAGRAHGQWDTPVESIHSSPTSTSTAPVPIVAASSPHSSSSASAAVQSLQVRPPMLSRAPSPNYQRRAPSGTVLAAHAHATSPT